MDARDDGEEAAPRAKRVRFSEETEVRIVEVEAAAGSEEGPPGARRAAAAGMMAAEDRALMEDVLAAEEDYEDPDEMFTSDGIPIEPFHLKREREEGYFDAEGNYIRYRREAEDDAWLESLGTGPVEADEALIRRLHARAVEAARREAEATGGDGDGGGGAVLDADDIAAYKRQLAELLLPGETVLGALRRLGCMVRGDESRRAAGRARRAAVGDAGEGPGLDGTPPGRPSSANGAASGDQEPAAPTTPATGGDGAAPLQTEGPAGAGPGSSGAASDGGTTGGRRSPPASGGSGRGRRGGAGLAGVAGGRRVPPANARAFERLTDYADILLAAGELSVYDTPREKLLQQAEAPAAPAAAARRAAGAGNTAAAAGEGEGNGTTEAAAAVAAAPAVDDVDMFGSDEEGGGAEEGPGSSGPVGQQQGQAPGQTEQQQQQQQQHEQQQVASPDDADMRDDRGAGSSDGGGGGSSSGPPGEPSAAAAGAANGSAGVLDGFVLDETSGYFYSDKLGYYFDPKTGLFGDPSSGSWFEYGPDGAYRLAGSGTDGGREAAGGSSAAAAAAAGGG